MMELRRALAFTLACGLLWMPRATEAQQPTGKTARIGYLGFRGPSPADEGFRQGLRERGYVEGQNVAIGPSECSMCRVRGIPGGALGQENVGGRRDADHGEGSRC